MNSKELRDKKVEEVIAKLDRNLDIELFEKAMVELWDNFTPGPDQIFVTNKGRKLLEKYLKRGNAKRKVKAGLV